MALKLKSKHKREWLKALRSGEYQQARCDLMDHDGGCCALGIGFDVLLDDWWILLPEIMYGWSHGWFPQSMMKGDDDPFSMFVSDWFKKPRGRDEAEFCDSVDIFVRDIAEMNDAEELSLAEIADYIEKNH